MKALKIAIGCDHAGYSLKEEVKKFLEDLGHLVWDFGTHSDESIDYPDIAHPLAKAVADGDYSYGFLLCGSGNGMSITANKHQGVRAAVCWNDEISRLARQHNNANICAVPARYLHINDAKVIVKAFIESDFEGGRHSRRVDKIPIKS